MKTIRYIDANIANRNHSLGEYMEWFKEIVSEKVDSKAVGCVCGGTMTWDYVETTFCITPEYRHQTDIKFDFNTHEVIINVH